MGANTGENDGGIYGFGDVVYGSKTEALRLVFNLGLGGNKDYGDAPGPLISLEL